MEGEDNYYDSAEDCLRNNIGSVAEETGEDSMINIKSHTIETKSGCASNQNLEKLVEKLQTLQNHVVSDLEDIANNLFVVKGLCSDQLEKSLSIVKTTEEADMER